MPAPSRKRITLLATVVVVGVALLGPSWPSVAAERGAAVTVEGSGFVIETLANDATAYSNRQYVWKEVPERFSGWQFTRTRGGVRAVANGARVPCRTVSMTLADFLPAVDEHPWWPRSPYGPKCESNPELA